MLVGSWESLVKGWQDIGRSLIARQRERTKPDIRGLNPLRLRERQLPCSYRSHGRTYRRYLVYYGLINNDPK